MSNKRNKVNIQNLTKQTTDIENLISRVEEDIKTNQEQLKIIEKNLNTNITKVIDLEITAEELETYKLNLNNIDTQLILLEDSVQALNNYKNQLNQVILEIQTEITIIQQSQDIE